MREYRKVISWILMIVGSAICLGAPSEHLFAYHAVAVGLPVAIGGAMLSLITLRGRE